MLASSKTKIQQVVNLLIVLRKRALNMIQFLSQSRILHEIQFERFED